MQILRIRLAPKRIQRCAAAVDLPAFIVADGSAI